MEKKFRSPLTYHELNAELGIKTGQEFDLEKNPSMTKPDEVMTLKDLIKRHYSGQNVPILDQQYNDNLGKFAENAPDISKMSKTEIAHYTQQLESFIKNSYEGIKKYNLEQDAKAEAERIRQETISELEKSGEEA